MIPKTDKGRAKAEHLKNAYGVQKTTFSVDKSQKIESGMMNLEDVKAIMKLVDKYGKEKIHELLK